MAEPSPAPVSPIGDLPADWEDLSLAPKWRTFVDPTAAGCSVGHAEMNDDRLTWCISPGEWTVLGPPPHGLSVVDVTHVRAALRIPTGVAFHLLPAVCALDLDERMFRVGGAARTEVAGVATEIVRQPSTVLLVVSRSYVAYVVDALIAAHTRP